ncbi:MAG TPA: hypothetical protein VK838_00310, partial [Candidatus Limnocylindrales bacterium]|nr:hypothetical protein [Candidatus Limnocylindrales bacterium]
MGKDPEERKAFPIEGDSRTPVGPGHQEAASSFDPTILDIGHYAGRTIEELGQTDPDYLRWLERHPSG